jgi:ParB family chromosome partitioning protein
MPPPRVRVALDADSRRLQDEPAESLGASVKLEPGRKGAGRIVIRYSSRDQLDGILARLRKR